MPELSLGCCVWGPSQNLDPDRNDRRIRRTMAPSALYTTLAALDAQEETQLSRQALQSPRAGVPVGSSYGGLNEGIKAQRVFHKHGRPSRLSPFGIVKYMHSTATTGRSIKKRFLGTTPVRLTSRMTVAFGPELAHAAHHALHINRLIEFVLEFLV